VVETRNLPILPPITTKHQLKTSPRDDQQRSVLVAEPLGDEGLALLQEKARVDVRLNLSPAELEILLPGYDALIVRSATKVTAALLEKAGQLTVIGRAGVGTDNIDTNAATERGIMVVNAPTTNIVAAAEHTVALMLALSRKIPQADRAVRAQQWQREKFTGTELVGKRLGLVGLGRVGAEVARRAIGLGMTVSAHDPYVTPERAQHMQVELLSFDDLLRTSDFISLHIPSTAETKRLLGAPQFAMMKPGARLINCARGSLIDETALLDALDSGQLAGAGLDVFTTEPLDNRRLLEHERVVLTPHIGGSTEESATRVSIEVAEEVLAVLEGRPARFGVNAPLIPSSLAPMLHPYLDLAERLGRFYIQSVGGPLGSVEIEYAGNIAAEDTSVLTAAVIKGLLETIHEDRVNLVNAQLVAQMHGLKIAERKTPEAARYENLIAITGARRIVGTVLQNEPHIAQLDGYWIDFIPKGQLLLTRHRDRPGMIGKVGTLLASENINIASMQVARDTPRGEAIMICTVDDPVPASAVERLRSELDMEWVKAFRL
jgi:D-3-phosphoglycerate dehydrogenase